LQEPYGIDYDKDDKNDKVTEKTKMTGNPFYAKGHVEPKYFANRKELFEFFTENVRDAAQNKNTKPDNITILGNWGIGKTSALLKFQDIIHNEMKECKNKDNNIELILTETNSGSLSSFQFIRLSCLFFLCQGNKSSSSRRGTRMTWIYPYPCASASSAQSVFYFIPSVFCVHQRLIFVSLNNRTRKNKPQMNADERRFVYMNTDALFFAYWYEIKLTTNTTNSIRTHATGVRLSSYKFVVFFMYIYEPQFMADFAVKILYPPNRSTDTNLKENTFFATRSKRSTPNT